MACTTVTPIQRQEREITIHVETSITACYHSGRPALVRHDAGAHLEHDKVLKGAPVQPRGLACRDTTAGPAQPGGYTVWAKEQVNEEANYAG